MSDPSIVETDPTHDRKATDVATVTYGDPADAVQDAVAAHTSLLDRIEERLQAVEARVGLGPTQTQTP